MKILKKNLFLSFAIWSLVLSVSSCNKEGSSFESSKKENTNGLVEKVQAKNSQYFAGKDIIWFGDSYTAGSGASPISNRFTTIVSNVLGANEINYGIAGTTIEKRVPFNYMAGSNMVDNIVNIPNKTGDKAMLVFAFGLNDMGQTAPDYNIINYKKDYQTILDNAFSKGWQPNQILIISAYYIDISGYNAYAAITGNAAPDVTRHLSFNTAAKEVSENNKTLYYDPYQNQVKNDITFFSPDHIHPNNTGYAYLADNLLEFLGKINFL